MLIDQTFMWLVIKHYMSEKLENELKEGLTKASIGKRKVWFYVSIFVVVSALYLLVSGSSILTIALDKNNSVPLGTFITWIGLISFPLMIFFGVKELRQPTNMFTKILGIFLKSMLILALLWLPISYLLAGNISFNFSENDSFQGGQLAMRWFWRLSYGIVIGSILILLIFLLVRLFKFIKRLLT